MDTGGIAISSPRASLRTYAGSKIEELEKYALQTQTGKRILTALYRSTLYSYVTQKINEFRDYKLIQDVKQHPLPRHIAVIMDGNRRFAQELGLSQEAGHVFGKMKIEEVLDWCFELGVPVLTIYAFSTENFKRSEKEISTLMALFKEELDKAKQDSRVHTNKVRIRIFGRLDLLPKEIQRSAKYVMEMTKQYESYHLNIALAYGGREEIVTAIQRIAGDVKNGKMKPADISQETVSSYLYTTGLPDPDLILRTSGEERISNFLLWQIAYSELYFSDVYWPAFQKRDFLRAIRTYQNRHRRFGE
ncbi:MAG TPA: polyprenyl diphosphate synthase [Candidatus Thermoplasmatota archaeon]|nr:polyprenyl diphosphate synthase [Candidatus Thermoplasmatota archaeon]